MQLHREHAGARLDQVPGQRAVTGADVQHELARSHAGLGDDPAGPVVNERVPAPRAPRPPGRGHDAPSP
nr:hypothetical protein [Labedaea rhizosphaerae]